VIAALSAEGDGDANGEIVDAQGARGASAEARCGIELSGDQRSDGVGKTAVGEYIRRAEVIGITWPVPDEIDDARVEQRMFDAPGAVVVARDDIDCVKVHEELKGAA
jgi:hypothetical protein